MNVGTICYTTCQGIAHLARDFYRNGIVNRVLTHHHPHYASDDDRYPDAMRDMEFLDNLDVLLLFETGLNWKVVKQAKAQGTKIVVMPMFEYTPMPFPVPVDMFICPSLLDLDYYPSGRFIPVPVQKRWRLREKALTFVHNAGHGQYNFGKGTPELIEAMDYVKSPITLLIRGQFGERRIKELFDAHQNNPRIKFMYGDVPEEELYFHGDVFVFPEKYNGLSLPLQEAYASGMLVMASNHYPANTWLPTGPLIPVREYVKHRIVVEFDWALIRPRDIAETMDDWYGKDITSLSLQGGQWAAQHSWTKLKPLYLKALEDVCQS